LGFNALASFSSNHRFLNQNGKWVQEEIPALIAESQAQPLTATSTFTATLPNSGAYRSVRPVTAGEGGSAALVLLGFATCVVSVQMQSCDTCNAAAAAPVPCRSITRHCSYACGCLMLQALHIPETLPVPPLLLPLCAVHTYNDISPVIAADMTYDIDSESTLLKVGTACRVTVSLSPIARNRKHGRGGFRERGGEEGVWCSNAQGSCMTSQLQLWLKQLRSQAESHQWLCS
jgi:hypothetical protein